MASMDLPVLFFLWGSVKACSEMDVERTVSVCMSNHYYTFGGELHKQTDGGAIGSSLTGEMARDVMGIWDIIFKKLV